MDDELVMVFPVSKLHELGYFQGFSRDFQRYLTPILTESFFIPRSDAEIDLSVKQLVPYAILQYDNLLFSYKRTGQESRLHNLYSIGIGGHINPQDPLKTFQSIPSHSDLGSLDAAVLREIDEEVSIKSASRSCIGVINDDSVPVGRVHFGIVYLFRLDTPEVKIKELSFLKDGKLISPTFIISHLQEYESWSRILMESISEWLT